MCGRYLLKLDAETLAREFGLAEPPEPTAPRHNIAPTQDVAVIVRREPGRLLRRARWGFLPTWAATSGMRPVINARAETAADKPLFREAFRRTRCLVPADGFYEWLREGRARRAFCFLGAGGRPLAFAGLLAPFTAPDGTRLATLAILTVAPNSVLRPVHDRMPALLDGDAREAWLDPHATPEQLAALLQTAPDDRLAAREVGPAVNDVRNDSEACLAPPPPPEPTLF
jgi:putative SOS response-associated peptidase YedK